MRQSYDRLLKQIQVDRRLPSLAPCRDCHRGVALLTCLLSISATCTCVLSTRHPKQHLNTVWGVPCGWATPVCVSWPSTWAVLLLLAKRPHDDLLVHVHKSGRYRRAAPNPISSRRARPAFHFYDSQFSFCGDCCSLTCSGSTRGLGRSRDFHANSAQTLPVKASTLFGTLCMGAQLLWRQPCRSKWRLQFCRLIIPIPPRTQ